MHLHFADGDWVAAHYALDAGFREAYGLDAYFENKILSEILDNRTKTCEIFDIDHGIRTIGDLAGTPSNRIVEAGSFHYPRLCEILRELLKRACEEDKNRKAIH